MTWQPLRFSRFLNAACCCLHAHRYRHLADLASTCMTLRRQMGGATRAVIKNKGGEEFLTNHCIVSVTILLSQEWSREVQVQETHFDSTVDTGRSNRAPRGCRLPIILGKSGSHTRTTRATSFSCTWQGLVPGLRIVKNQLTTTRK
jgi:hypothetical protein